MGSILFHLSFLINIMHSLSTWMRRWKIRSRRTQSAHEMQFFIFRDWDDFVRKSSLVLWPQLVWEGSANIEVHLGLQPYSTSKTCFNSETMAIPENREFQKWKLSFFHQRHTLSRSFHIFVITYRVIEWQTFCQNLSTCYYFLWKKLNFHFWFSPIFGLCRNHQRLHSNLFPNSEFPQDMHSISLVVMFFLPVWMRHWTQDATVWTKTPSGQTWDIHVSISKKKCLSRRKSGFHQHLDSWSSGSFSQRDPPQFSLSFLDVMSYFLCVWRSNEDSEDHSTFVAVTQGTESSTTEIGSKPVLWRIEWCLSLSNEDLDAMSYFL